MSVSPPKTIRPYQLEAVQKVINSGMSYSVIIALLPRTGKTFTAINIAKHYKKVIFTTPRNNLTDQTVKEFNQDFKGDVGFITSAKMVVDKRISIADLITLENRLKKGEITPNDYDLIIFDECHYSPEIIERIKKFFKCKIVGLSATPFDADGVWLDGWSEIFNKYDANYMVKNGYLKDMQIFQIDRLAKQGKALFNSDTLNTNKQGEYTDRSVSDALNENPEYTIDIVKSTARYLRFDEKVLVYAGSIKQCDLLTKEYSSRGYSVGVLHSKIGTKKQRKQVLEDFRNGKFNMLISVNMVTFGTDLPSVGTAVLARPIKSLSLWVQLSFRILTTSSGDSSTHAKLYDCTSTYNDLGHPFDVQGVDEVDKMEKGAYKCFKCKTTHKKFLKSVRFDSMWKIEVKQCPVCNVEQEVIKEQNARQCKRCMKIHRESAFMPYKGNHPQLVGYTYVLCCGYAIRGKKIKSLNFVPVPRKVLIKEKNNYILKLGTKKVIEILKSRNMEHKQIEKMLNIFAEKRGKQDKQFFNKLLNIARVESLNNIARFIKG